MISQIQYLGRPLEAVLSVFLSQLLSSEFFIFLIFTQTSPDPDHHRRDKQLQEHREEKYFYFTNADQTNVISVSDRDDCLNNLFP